MLVPNFANSSPAAPPRTDNSALSVSVFRMSRPRPAPRAARITSSRRSATARIISKLAKFAHAISKTRPTVPKSTSSADRTSPTSHSCSGTNWLFRSLYPAEEKERKSQLVPLHEWLVGDVRSALLVLFGTVGLVLLIACANFASLLMMRAVAERRELVIRAALGAGRGRLIRKTLTESALLSVLGGAAGLLFAKLGTSMLPTFRPEELARLSGIHMDTRVLLFVFVV